MKLLIILLFCSSICLADSPPPLPFVPQSPHRTTRSQVEIKYDKAQKQKQSDKEVNERAEQQQNTPEAQKRRKEVESLAASNRAKLIRYLSQKTNSTSKGRK